MSLLILFLACGEKDSSGDDTSIEADTDTDADSDSDSDSDADTDADADADTDLRDLREGLDNEPCDSEVNGYEGQPGAARYFYGYFDHADPQAVVGLEQAILKATSEWDNGDCVISWDVAGTRGAALGCEDCEFSLDLTMVLNEGETDCPSALVDQLGGESYTVEYDVDEDFNGVSHFHYHQSGTHLGSGVYDETRSTYITSTTCMWF